MQAKFICFNTKRPFGVEMEVNGKVPQPKLAEIIVSADSKRNVDVYGWHESNGNSNWHVKTDSTCGDKGAGSGVKGFEIASFIAKGYKDLKTIADVAGTLKDYGVQVNNHCGLHIHAQIKDYSLSMVATVASYWGKIEPILIEAVPERRRNTKYCKMLTSIYNPRRNKSFSVDRFWQKIKPRNYSASDKRTTLNFTNYLKNRDYGGRVTAELRLPEGTLDPIDVKNWTRLFVHFISMAKKLDSPSDLKEPNLEEALQILGLHNDEPYFILSSGLFETKLWFLNRILRFSSRNDIREQSDDIIRKMIEPKIKHSSLKNVLGNEVYEYYTSKA